MFKHRVNPILAGSWRTQQIQNERQLVEMKNGKLKGKNFFDVEQHLVIGFKFTKAADSSERA